MRRHESEDIVTLPTILENQSLYRPVTSTYTTGTVSSLSQIGILLFGSTELNDATGKRAFNVVGHDAEYVDGQIVKAKWAIVEGSARQV